MEFKQRLIEVLSIPTIPGHETGVSDYIKQFCKEHDITVHSDVYGNVYATKGVSDVYPCVASHMDTVHTLRKHVVKERDGEELYAVREIDGQPTGIGGDDKAGVSVCLQLLLETDILKAAFFVAEEVGCLGSYLSDKTFFENVGYTIQFDAPYTNWISYRSDGEQLFEIDSDFFSKIEPIFIDEMPDYSRKCLGNHPYTDVSALKRLYDFTCINYSCGYYNMHTAKEYVRVNDVKLCLSIAKKMIEVLGCTKYEMTGTKHMVTEGFIDRVKRSLIKYQLYCDE